MSDGTIIIDTKVDSSGAENGVKGLSGKLGSLTSGALGLFAKGVAIAGTAMAIAGGASIKLASDLSEVQNVVDTTFGDNASKINDWAKNASTGFGLSELQAKQFNGTMGAMLKSMGLSSDETLNMSESMVGLAGDFASFYNLDSEEAFAKIRSGISGETEPLKQLGINMSVANLNAFALSSGLGKTYDSMTQGEQATLRYNYLMSVSKDAQGDFAKTSDSLANQLRIAKLSVQDLGASIGTALMPMAKDAIKSLNGMVGQLKDAFKTGGFEGLAGKLGDVLGQIISKVAEKLPNIVNLGITIIKSFVTGLQNNLPMITSSAVQIITSLVTGILTLLPQLLTMGMQIIANLLSGIGSALPTLIPMAVQCVGSLIQALYDNMPAIIKGGLDLLQGLATGIVNAIPVLVAMLPQIITSMITYLTTCLPMILQTGMTILLALINGLVDAMPQLIAMLPVIIESILGFITNNLPEIITLGIQVLIALINGLSKALPQLVAMLPMIITSIMNVITRNLPQIINAGIKILIALISGLVQTIPRLVAMIPQIIDSIMDAFSNVNWGEIGTNILKGIGDGLVSGVGTVISSAKSACASIKDSIASFWDIHSPSRLARDLFGRNIIRGIGVGVDLETPNLTKDIQNNLSNLTTKLKNTVDYQTARTTANISASANRSAGVNNDTVTNNDNGVIQNININQPVKSPAEVARAIKRVGRDLVLGY